MYLNESSSRMRVMNHNWSARKQRLHLQNVAEISRHSALSLSVHVCVNKPKSVSYSTQVVASHGRCFYVCLIVVARWRCNRWRCRREICPVCSWEQTCRLIAMMGVVLRAVYLFC